MADQRQAEIMNAQNNPNILNNLSGAPSPVQMQPQQVAQQAASAIGGGQFVPGSQATQEQAMQQLFQTDMASRAAQQGASPFPQISGYIPNPNDIIGSLASTARGWGSIGQTAGAAASQTQEQQQMATNAVMGVLMDIVNQQQQQKQFEEQMKLQREQLELDRQRMLRSGSAAGGGRSIQEMLGLTGTTMPTREQVLQAMTITADPHELSRLETMLSMLDEGQQGFGDLAVGEQNRYLLAQSGKQAVEEVEQLLRQNPNKLYFASLPGKFGARDYESAAFRAVDALIRLRTGATMNKDELEAYKMSVMPRAGDTDLERQQKLDRLKSEYDLILSPYQGVRGVGQPQYTAGFSTRPSPETFDLDINP